MAVKVLIVGVDIGSVRRKGGFAWTTEDDKYHGQDDPLALARVLVTALDSGRQVAVALECPLSVPVPSPAGNAWINLGRARVGEGNRSWSAGAGTGALATGLVQLAWLCGYIAEHAVTPPPTTTQRRPFLAGEAQLFIAEAMVTADGKPEAVDRRQDHADASAAAKRLNELINGQIEQFQPDVCCSPQRPLNLAATAALHAGLPIDPAEVMQEVLVAKVQPIRR